VIRTQVFDSESYRIVYNATYYINNTHKGGSPLLVLGDSSVNGRKTTPIKKLLAKNWTTTRQS